MAQKKRGRGVEVKTRDPKPGNRDPQLPLDDNKREPDEPRQVSLPRLPKVIALHVPLVRCSACGHGTMRTGGGTRPDMTTGMMARRKECAHCGQKYCVFTEPTEAEIKRHWQC